MNQARSTHARDVLVRGLIDGGQARFYAISARDLVQIAHVNHSTSATCTAALGRTLMGASLLGAMEKGQDDEVSVIIKGGGPAGSIVCVGRSDASVKGYIQDPSVELPARSAGKLDVGGAVGKDGTITVIRDIGLKEPYIGRADLVSGEIAEDFGAYFAYSAQQPALVYLGVHVSRDFEVSAATGLIVQPLPGCDDDLFARVEACQSSVPQLTKLVKEGLSLPDALGRVLPGLTLTVLDELSTRFSCDCSRQRLERVLISLGEAELQDMIERDNGAELTCRFCQKQYYFAGEELERILMGARSGANFPA